LCGIFCPGVLEATPEGLSLNFELVSTNQDLDTTVSCLSEKQHPITGRFDLQAKVAAQGKADALANLLKGSIDLTTREGRIYKLTILSKILHVLNVTEIARGNIPDLTKEGFAYRSLSIQGELQDEKLALNGVVLDGSTMEMVGQGHVDLIKNTVKLEVLVAPLKTVDYVVKKIPIIKDITRGTLVVIPLVVEGTIDDPTVTVVSPSMVKATFSRLFRMMENTLKVPVQVDKRLIPGRGEK
jgi:uncharacterized protein YhdP